MPRGQVPPIAYMVEDQGLPVVVQVTGRTFTTAGGQDTHTAVTARAQRSRTLPAMLLSLAALVSFNVFGLAAGGPRSTCGPRIRRSSALTRRAKSSKSLRSPVLRGPTGPLRGHP